MDRKALLGRRIKEIRRKRGMSQETLAERAGISTQYVSNIERGLENPTLDLLFSLADGLKASVVEMFDYELSGDMDRKKLQAVVRDLVGSAEPDQLRVVLRVLKAVLR